MAICSVLVMMKGCLQCNEAGDGDDDCDDDSEDLVDDLIRGSRWL